MRGAIADRLWSSKLLEGREFESGYVSESGMDKAAKGEGWALHFINCAQDTVDSNPHCPCGF